MALPRYELGSFEKQVSSLSGRVPSGWLAAGFSRTILETQTDSQHWIWREAAVG